MENPMLATVPKRLALIAAVVLTVAGTTQCSSAALQSGSGSNSYLMAAGDSTGPVCVHLDMPYSDWQCPVNREADYFRPSQVTAETLVVHTVDNRTIRVAIPNRTDAIFLTQSAQSTFLLRHYDATNPSKAAALRAYMAGAYKRPR
jgi:hypothetical protein